ncbi:MAG: cysteine desulfurase family protein [Clostridia bacterium]
MIYLDNAATTKTYLESAEIAAKYSVDNFFNPSALYSEAVGVFKDIKQARETLKQALRIGDGELYFVSGGSEADNTALFSTRKPKGSKIVVSVGEHDAIIQSANQLKEQGYNVVFAPINKDGSVNEQEFINLLDDTVSLVSIMHVSNETGAINDIKKLVKLTRKYAPNAVFHSDGVQAFCKINVNLRSLDVDLYSISGHKIHAPKGIGALYVKNGISIKPFVFGGGQEKGMRSGTENTPVIMAFEDAVKRNIATFDEKYSKKAQYVEQLRNRLVAEVPNIITITPEINAAPHILTVAFEGVRGEVLLHSLEKHNILVGIGSACSSHHESRFKSLLGLDDAHKDGIVRFSVSEFNDVAEIETVVSAIKEEISTLTNYQRN